MAFSPCLLHYPIFTSDDLSPLRGDVSLPQLLFQALTHPCNLQPWFKSPRSCSDCLHGCTHQGFLSLWSLLLNQSLLALPLLCPSSNSLLGFPACHYGKSIWGDTYVCYFSHLPVFQMEFWASAKAANEFPPMPSKIFTDNKFQEPCLSFPFPALNYRSIASLAVFLFVGFSVPLEHPLLCSTLQGLSLSPGALPTHRQSGLACTITASGASGVGEDLGWELDLLVNLPFAILKHPWLASCRCTSAACSATYSHLSPTARSLLWPWNTCVFSVVMGPEKVLT